MPSLDSNCPLCLHRGGSLFHQDRLRVYWSCPQCELIYVPARYHISVEAARRRYDTHRNKPDDPGHAGYRAFLNRLLNVLVPLLPPGCTGLDFGSGPEPVLSLLMAEQGFQIKNYDPLYANLPSLLEQTYDFVTCAETMEHFTQPRANWECLLGLVKHGGWLGIMTQFVTDRSRFPNWYYKRDVTHVCFYSRETIEWLAQRYALSAHFYESSVAVFQR